MFPSAGFSKRLGLFLLVQMLSACVEGGPGPGGYYPPPRPSQPPPQMCTMEYRPVCGERGGREQTFSNSCQARERGYRIVGSGECRPAGRPDWDRRDRERPDWDRPGSSRPDRPERDGRDWPDRERPGRPPRESQAGFCTREYRPVCGQQGSRTRTFPNACEARNAGFGVVASGECRR